VARGPAEEEDDPVRLKAPLEVTARNILGGPVFDAEAATFALELVCMMEEIEFILLGFVLECPPLLLLLPLEELPLSVRLSDGIDTGIGTVPFSPEESVN
jgi:hypothetical protein